MTRVASSIAPRILVALEAGPMHKRQLCRALGLDYVNVDPVVADLVHAKRVVILGTAKEAGYADIKAHARMYGLPGQKLVPIKRRACTSSGSGVIAGRITIPQYRWPLGRMR